VCRRDDDCGAGRKGNDNPAFPEDGVATSRGVEVTKSDDGAATKREVVAVQVSETGRFRAKIDSGGGPGAFGKIGTEVRVAFEKGIAAAGVVVELLRHP
jgi:hypothetical protein